MSFSVKVREMILSRDGHRCVRCNMRSTQIHHRRPRGMGGTKREDTAANGIVLCGSGTTGCHSEVESYRSTAYEHGFLVRQNAEPSEVPIMIRGRWWLLTDDGRMVKMT